MIAVHITTACGDSWETEINGTIEEARAYFVGQTFNLGDGAGGDRMVRAVSCELCAADEASSPASDRMGSNG